MTVRTVARLAAALLVLAPGCRDDASAEVADETPDCSTECDEPLDDVPDEFPEETGVEPLDCDGRCADFQTCINNVCQPAPALPECAGPLTAVPIEVDLAITPTELSITGVVAVDLGLGGGDDLVVVAYDRFAVVPADRSLPPFELSAPPGETWGTPLIGELSGDDIADLLLPGFGTPELVVYEGDGQGGFFPGATLQPPGDYWNAYLTVDVDGDGHHEVIADDGNRLYWLNLQDGLLTETVELGPRHNRVDSRLDDAGQLELWTAGDHVRRYRGLPWTDESVALPVPIDLAYLGFGRYTGRGERDVLIPGSYEGRTFVILGNGAEALHAREVPDGGFMTAAGDLDGDGLDELVYELGRVVLGLADGTIDDPLAAACVTDIVDLPGRVYELARFVEGEPTQIVSAENGATEPSFYVLEPRP